MRYVTALLLSCSLVACGDLNVEQKEVEYDRSCQRVSCPNADDVSKTTSGDSQSITCTWNCATYKGETDQYVSLTFWQGGPWGSCWSLESTHTSGGICQ